MDIAISKNNVPIRLTSERWQHISIGHPEVADFYYEILETIENPQIIYEGSYGGLMAVSFRIAQTDKFIVVVYKELSSSDGFVITAYISNKDQKFGKKKVIWPHADSLGFYESLIV
ncbi:MAG TPA: hypothetical protein DHV48_14660 [Prolixibacteraceae bacterium]|nr:hypothetical protein [Prolixibacteraceae bacterium]